MAPPFDAEFKGVASERRNRLSDDAPSCTCLVCMRVTFTDHQITLPQEAIIPRLFPNEVICKYHYCLLGPCFILRFNLLHPITNDPNIHMLKNKQKGVTLDL